MKNTPILSGLKRKVISVLAVVAAVFTALPAGAMSRGEDLCLIINSYHEDELWANRMAQPVELYLVKNDTIRTEQVFLNNSSVIDMQTYEAICDNIFNTYANNHPSYVVMVGNFAFTLRDRIRQEWGDIPILLISRIETYAPVEQYFASNNDTTNFEDNEQLPLGQLRKEYNFSAVIVPDFYEQNIKLMLDLIPNMKELVFISDKAYVNKIAAMNIQSVLSESHPDINFRWLQGSEENSMSMLNLIIKPQPQTGLLLSSWVYEVQNTRGIGVLTTKDLTFLSGAVNPVFTLRQLYMKMGAIGGVFVDNDVIAQDITNMVDAMIKGQDMHHLPFVVPTNPEVCVSYPLMKKYGLDLGALPAGSIIVDKPETYLERYGLITAILIVVLIVIILVILWRNKVQRDRINMLQRHQNFINQMPMPYTKSTLWLDKDNNVINISYDLKNDAYEDLIKRSSLPDNPLHLFTNSYLSDIAKQLIQTHKPVSIRHHFKRSDLYCYFIFVPLTHTKAEQVKKRDDANAHTNRLELDVFAIDITKDHQMQQQLRDQAITIDISMEMAKIVPWQWDIVNDTLSFYTYRNYLDTSSATTSDGKSTSVMKFDDLLKLMPDTDAEALTKVYRKIVRGEISRIDMEFRLARLENENVYEWCENHGVVTDTDSDGRPLRMTGSIQFITDRKQQEQEMSQALTKAKESDMLKSAFLANMSHEIRTPLNAIVGFSNLLTTSDDIEDRREFAEIINRNNELLLSLINDVLDLAKIESNTITLTYDLSDIHDVVDSISKTVSIRVPKGVKLNVAHYADSCVVRCDAGHVSQILINLLTNATKFTQRGSITVGYEIFEDEKKLYFYVKDTGIGIKKENLDKVFNRFVKLNNFVQGSGLGLAICRTLVEKMNGEIGVESAGEGRGCLFWFTIPYDPIDLKVATNDTVVVRSAADAEHTIGDRRANRPEQAAADPAGQKKNGFEFKSPGDISQNVMADIPDGINVLVAEDNPSNYWLMARLMQDKFKLYHAENGQIALDMLDEVKPQIIVMDINMPELDGYAAVAEMRHRGVTAPIIAVTAYAFASDRIRILNSGFDAFVSKPVSASILYDTINDVWQRKLLKKEKDAHRHNGDQPTDNNKKPSDPDTK